MDKDKNAVRRWISTSLEIWGIWQFVRTIGLLLAGATAMILAIREWIHGLDTSGHILIVLFLVGLALVGIAFWREWQVRRSINYIPKLLLLMDTKMKALIELAKFPEDEVLDGACKDLAEIFDIDVPKVAEVVRVGNKVEIRKMFKSATLLNRPNPIPTNALHLLAESLFYIQGTLDNYEIGLESVKDIQYKRLEKRFLTLKHREQLIPAGANTIKQLTNYTLWWEGYNSFLLLMHYDSKFPIPPDVLSPKFRSLLPNIRKQIEGIITNHHADVLKSMQRDK